MALGKPTDLIQGTLDLLILKIIALQPMHGWGIAQRIRQLSKDVLQVNQAGATQKIIVARNTIRSHAQA
jgi:hypothetical protein